MRFLFSILFVACFFNLKVHAQQPVVQLFEQYIDELNAVNEKGTLQGVYDVVDTSFVTNLTYIGLTGKVKRSQKDFNKYSADLLGMTTQESMSLNLTIEDIGAVAQGEQSASLTAKLHMDLIINDYSAEKGSFTVNMLAKRFGDRWKFVHSDVVRTVEIKNTGACLCYIYQREKGYVTEVFYPAGMQYEKGLNVFRVNRDNAVIVLTVEGLDYEWGPENRVYKTFISGKEEIGVAKTEQEAVTLILGWLYNDDCLRFTFDDLD